MSHPSIQLTSRRWLGLAAIATAQFMVIMDTSIIGVALPRMRTDLGFSQGTLSWVFNAYVVTFAGLLLLGGKLSDIVGARNVFAGGWIVLIVGSIIAGSAGTASLELAGRAVQGAGSALIAPSALALLMMLFGAHPHDLTKAFALYGAAAPAGGTAGVFLGGLITQYASWPWVFFINVPIALLVLAAIPVLMPASGPVVRRGVDALGAITITSGLTALVYAIVRAPEVGWGSSKTWAILAGAVVLLIAFLIQQAVRREPLMPLGIFRTPTLGAANLTQLLLGAAWIPMWFFLNLYLQQVLDYAAFPSGAALLPMTTMIMVGMVVMAPRAIGRFGPKNVTVAGLLLLAAGMAWLSFVRPDGTFVVDVLPASLVAALGMSLAFIPTLGIAISAARPEDGGLAAGIVNTAYQTGSSIGLAILTAVATAYGADQIGHPAPLTHGFSAAFIGAAAVALVAAASAAALLRLPSAPAAADQPVPDRVG